MPSEIRCQDNHRQATGRTCPPDVGHGDISKDALNRPRLNLKLTDRTLRPSVGRNGWPKGAHDLPMMAETCGITISDQGQGRSEAMARDIAKSAR